MSTSTHQANLFGIDHERVRQWLDDIDPEEHPFVNAAWDPYSHYDRDSRADIHVLLDRAQEDGMIRKPVGSRIYYDADDEGLQTWLVDLDQPDPVHGVPLRLAAPVILVGATDLRGVDAALDLLSDAVAAANLCAQALVRYAPQHQLS